MTELRLIDCGIVCNMSGYIKFVSGYRFKRKKRTYLKEFWTHSGLQNYTKGSLVSLQEHSLITGEVI